MAQDWNDLAASVKWIKKPHKGQDGTWDLTGARLNLCYNALDRHVIDGRADDVALRYESALTGVKASYTYADLLDEVGRAAGVLTALGVEVGESVILCMPAIPELIITMLACLRVGACVEVISPHLTPQEIAQHIDALRPAVVISSSSSHDRHQILPWVEVMAASKHFVGYRIVVQTGDIQPELGERDFDWNEVMQPGAVQSAGCASVKADVAAMWRENNEEMTAGEVLEVICANNALMPPQKDDVCLLHAVSDTPSALTIPLLEHMFSGAVVVLVEGNGGVEEVAGLGSAYQASTVIPC